MTVTDDLTDACRTPIVVSNGITLYPVYKGATPLMYSAARRPVAPGTGWPTDALLDMRSFPEALWLDAANSLPSLSISARFAIQAEIWGRIIAAGHLSAP